MVVGAIGPDFLKTCFYVIAIGLSIHGFVSDAAQPTDRGRSRVDSAFQVAGDADLNQISRFISMATTAVRKSARCFLHASDENSVLAAAIATGQLEYALRHLKSRVNHDNLEVIEELGATLALLDTIRGQLKTTEKDAELKHHSRDLRVFHNSFWRFDPPRRSVSTEGPCSSFTDISEMFGPLTEDQTDRCLVEISQQQLGQCTLSEECQQQMIESMDCVGYTGTHQMLYMLLSWRMQCSEHFSPSFEYLLNNCSSSMFTQYCAIMNNKFPQEVQDIFMEYVLFGALTGFEDYLEDDTFLKILEWQHDDGCYYATDVTDASEPLIDLKNNMHKTSLATAVMGVFAKHYALL